MMVIPDESTVVIDPANPKLIKKGPRTSQAAGTRWDSPLIGRRVAVTFDGGKKYVAIRSARSGEQEEFITCILEGEVVCRVGRAYHACLYAVTVDSTF